MGKDQAPKSFKDFLDKCNNLISIFGAFIALFIYATTIPNQTVVEFLLPTFLILSILVWWELILFAIESNDGSRKYELFYFLLCCIELGLFFYFYIKFSSLLLWIAYFGLFFLITFLFSNIQTKIFTKRLIKLNPKQRKTAIFFILLTSLLLAFAILKLTSPLTKPVFKTIFKTISFDSTKTTK